MTKNQPRMLTKGRRTVTVWGCKCERCGHAWESIGSDPPRHCASCKLPNWNVKAGTLKRGPKPGTRRRLIAR